VFKNDKTVFLKITCNSNQKLISGMKKLSILFSMLSIFQFATKAQITITAADISPIGFTAQQSRDSFPDASIQAGGTGELTWDFSALKDMDQDTLSALDPSTTPYASEFPGASFAVKRDTSLYIYFTKNDDALTLLGISGKLYYQTYLVEGSLKFSPVQSVLKFPATENSAHMESVKSTVQVHGSAIGSTFDSLRLRTFTDRDVKFDAFGELVTPAGTFQTLRATETETSHDSVYVYSSGFWFPLQGTQPKTTVFHNWWTNQNGLGFPVVQIESNDAGEIRMVSWLKDAVNATGEAGNLVSLSVFPNPATDVLTVEIPELFEGSLDVYDMNGKLVLTKKIQSQVEKIGLQGLTPGAHVVVLKNKTGQLKGFTRFAVVK
jgi:hypothetical protein